MSLCSLNLGQIVLERLLKETEIFLCKIGCCSITMDVMLQHFRLTVPFVFNTINKEETWWTQNCVSHVENVIF